MTQAFLTKNIFKSEMCTYFCVLTTQHPTLSRDQGRNLYGEVEKIVLYIFIDSNACVLMNK